MELVEFKTKKLTEEREEKIRHKKEIKKAKKKLEKDTVTSDDKLADVSEENPGKVGETQEFVNNEKESPTDENDNHELEPVDVKKEVIADELLREPVVVNENDEGFIGPKLPRLMTRAECDALREELFSKYFPRKVAE